MVKGLVKGLVLVRVFLHGLVKLIVRGFIKSLEISKGKGISKGIRNNY